MTRRKRCSSSIPNRKEAGLVVGTYRYLVSTLSLPMRLMAYVAGFGGGKEHGLQMIEETAAAAGENRTDAEFALVLLYNREKRYDDAMRVLGNLRRRYPRNRLVLLEAGATATRGEPARRGRNAADRGNGDAGERQACEDSGRGGALAL